MCTPPTGNVMTRTYTRDGALGEDASIPYVASALPENALMSTASERDCSGVAEQTALVISRKGGELEMVRRSYLPYSSARSAGTLPCLKVANPCAYIVHPTRIVVPPQSATGYFQLSNAWDSALNLHGQGG